MLGLASGSSLKLPDQQVLIANLGIVSMTDRIFPQGSNAFLSGIQEFCCGGLMYVNILYVMP